MNKKQLGYGGIILLLGLFVIKPLLTDIIKKYRYNKEIRPIREGMIEIIKRKQQSFPGARGGIYTLSTFPDPEVSFINGYPEIENDSAPYYDIILQTPSGYMSFSRDTTVGQVVGVLVDHHDNVKEEDKNRIFNIYYKAGTATIDKRINRSVDIMRVYLKDSLYQAVFIANTFDKDSTSKPNRLAQKRLKHIRKALGSNRKQYYQRAFE